MKRMRKNLGLRENGYCYLDIKRDGRQDKEAKRRLKAELAKLNTETAIGKAGRSLNGSNNHAEIKDILRTVLSESPFSVAGQPDANERPPFRRALEDHFRSIVTDSLTSRDRQLTQKKKLLRLCSDWDEFDPCVLWSKVQNELRNQSAEARCRPDPHTKSRRGDRMPGDIG